VLDGATVEAKPGEDGGRRRRVVSRHATPVGSAWREGVGLVVFALIAAAAARTLLYHDLPAFLPNDSWDYLRAAGDIHRAADFFSPALRDVRLPGYPTLLALAHPLTGARSDSIVLLQAVLGMASVALGWTMGAIVGSRLVSRVMVLFLGLSPVYLLNEHVVMSETFSLTLFTLVVVAGLASLRPAAGWMPWVCLGFVLGLAVLTRANIVVLGAALVAGGCLVRAPRPVAGERPSSRAIRGLGRLGPAAACLAVAAVVVAPWLWRNWAAYGHVALYSSSNSNVLLYKDMHAPLDGSMPTLSRLNQMLEREQVDFEWQRRLQRRFAPAEAERVARRILVEQVVEHPWRHLADIGESAAGWIGFPGAYGNERSALRYWFREFVGHAARMNALASEAVAAPTIPGWVFVPAGGDTRATRLFARLGDVYLWPGRAIAFVGVLGLYVAWRSIRRGPHDETRSRVVLILSVGYLGTLAMHALMVTDYDRYATLFDFVVVLIAALMADDVLSARRATVATIPEEA
jgi:hypothetical protein